MSLFTFTAFQRTSKQIYLTVVYTSQSKTPMPAGMHGSAVRREGELCWDEVIAMLKKQAKSRTVEQEKGLDKQGTFVGQLSSKPGCFGDNLCFI